MTLLYFQHIPRTSGSFVVNYIVHNFALPQNNRKLVESASAFVAGHYGTNISPQNNLDCKIFSIVRNPYDHIVSRAIYHAIKHHKIIPDRHYVDKFINGEFENIYENPTWGCSNMQAKFLSCRVVSLDELGVNVSRTPNGSKDVFVLTDLKESTTIEEIIKGKTILCFDKREKIKNWIDDTVLDLWGIVMTGYENNIVNSLGKYDISLSLQQKRIIENNNRLDFDIYEYSKSL